MILRDGVVIAALLVFIGELGIPTGIPVEVALLLAGAYTLHSTPALLAGLALVVAADISGTTTLHLVAKTGGSRLLQRWWPRSPLEDASRRSPWHARLQRHPVLAVFIGRLLPIARMYVTVASGLAKLALPDFLLGAVPGSLLWAGIPLLTGYLFRTDARQLAAHYTLLTRWAVVVLPLLGIGTLLVWWLHRSGSWRIRLQRGRILLSLGMGLWTVGYVLETARDVIPQARRAAFPVVTLAGWLVLLAGMSLTLLLAGIHELRVSRRQRTCDRPWTTLVRSDWVITVIWFVLALAAGMVMLGLEFHYPAI